MIAHAKPKNSVSVILPCFNEAKNIPYLIPHLQRLKKRGYEIILVDDGSTDGSRNLLAKIEDDFKVLYHDRNLGKGVAIKTGIKCSTGNFIAMLDADLEHDPKELPKLVSKLKKSPKEVAAVYGSRFLGHRYGMGIFRLLGNIVISIFTSLLYASLVTDVMTGYKVVKKQILDLIELESEGFLFEPEITAKILSLAYEIREVPINYRRRKFGEAKIKPIDGIYALLCLLKYKFKSLY